jgi:hypothetical protein
MALLEYPDTTVTVKKVTVKPLLHWVKIMATNISSDDLGIQEALYVLQT